MQETQPNDGYFEAYWPRATRTVKPGELAPRPRTLDGKRVAFLWDFLFRGDEIFAVIEEELRKRFPSIEFLGWKETGNIHGPDERAIIASLPARLKAARVDAVITAVAA